MDSVSLRFLLIVAEGLNCAASSLCVFWVAGGAGVLHPRALLSDVHVCWRVGHTWPEYPPALLPSVEVRSHNRCLFCWDHFRREPSLSSFSGFSTGRLTARRLCTTPWAWWMPTFSTTARRSPGVSWAFICSLSSIISTGRSKHVKPVLVELPSKVMLVFVCSLLKHGLRLGEFLLDHRRWGEEAREAGVYIDTPSCFAFYPLYIKGLVSPHPHPHPPLPPPLCCLLQVQSLNSLWIYQTEVPEVFPVSIHRALQTKVSERDDTLKNICVKVRFHTAIRPTRALKMECVRVSEGPFSQDALGSRELRARTWHPVPKYQS